MVGDVTILEHRAKFVEFTQPFVESGLSMMVQYKPEPTRAWLFLKPFSRSMWLATLGILFYTMFIVWFFERKSNPDFKGAFRDQLGTTMWFTFSTLFFAQSKYLHKLQTGVLQAALAHFCSSPSRVHIILIIFSSILSLT